MASEFNINSIPTLMIIRDATVLFAKPGMLPEKVLTDLVDQARKVRHGEGPARNSHQESANIPIRDRMNRKISSSRRHLLPTVPLS